jgi:hypothetical protein
MWVGGWVGVGRVFSSDKCRESGGGVRGAAWDRDDAKDTGRPPPAGLTGRPVTIDCAGPAVRLSVGWAVGRASDEGPEWAPVQSLSICCTATSRGAGQVGPCSGPCSRTFWHVDSLTTVPPIPLRLPLPSPLRYPHPRPQPPPHQQQQQQPHTRCRRPCRARRPPPTAGAGGGSQRWAPPQAGRRAPPRGPRPAAGRATPANPP